MPNALWLTMHSLNDIKRHKGHLLRLMAVVFWCIFCIFGPVSYAAKPKLVIIADIHHNPYVQKGIYKYLLALRGEGLKGVFVGGGFGKGDFSFVRSGDFAARLFGLGLLSGGEFFAYKSHLPLFGLERPATYLKAMGAYMSLSGQRGTYGPLYRRFSDKTLLGRFFLKGLLLKLSYPEWNALSDLSDIKDFPAVEAMADFYRLADERSSDFVRTIVARMKRRAGLYAAVMGGYHFKKVISLLPEYIDVEVIYPMRKTVPEFNAINPVVRYKETHMGYMPILPALSLSPGKAYVRSVARLMDYKLPAKSFCLPVAVRDRWVGLLKKEFPHNKKLLDFVENYGPGMWDTKENRMALFFEYIPVNKSQREVLWNGLIKEFSDYFGAGSIDKDWVKFEAMVRFHEAMHFAFERDMRFKSVLNNFRKKIRNLNKKYPALFDSFYLAYGKMPGFRAVEEMLVLYCQWRRFYSLETEFLKAWVGENILEEVKPLFEESYQNIVRLFSPSDMIGISKRRLDLSVLTASFLCCRSAIEKFPIDAAVKWIVYGARQQIFSPLPDMKHIPVYVDSIESSSSSILRDNRFNMDRDLKNSDSIFIISRGSFGSVSALIAGAVLGKQGKNVYVQISSDNLFYLDQEVIDYLVSVLDINLPILGIGELVKNGVLTVKTQAPENNQNYDMTIVMGAKGVSISRISNISRGYIIMRSDVVPRDIRMFLLSNGEIAGKSDVGARGLIMASVPKKRPVSPGLEQIISMSGGIDFELLYKDADYVRELETEFFNGEGIEAQAEELAVRSFNLWKSIPKECLVVGEIPQWSSLNRILNLKNISVVSPEGISEEYAMAAKNGVFIESGRDTKWMPVLIKAFGWRSGMQAYSMLRDMHAPVVMPKSVQVFYPDGLKAVLLDSYVFHKVMAMIKKRNVVANVNDVPVVRENKGLIPRKREDKIFSGAGKRYFQRGLWDQSDNNARDFPQVLDKEAVPFYKSIVKNLFKGMALDDGLVTEEGHNQIISKVIKADKYTAFVLPFSYYTMLEQDEGLVPLSRFLSYVERALSGTDIGFEKFFIKYLPVGPGIESALYAVVIPDEEGVSKQDIEDIKRILKQRGLIVGDSLVQQAFRKSHGRLVCVAPMAIGFRTHFNVDDRDLEVLLTQRGAKNPNSLDIKSEIWDFVSQQTASSEKVNVDVRMPISVSEYKRKHKKELEEIMSIAFSGGPDYFKGYKKKQLIGILYRKLPIRLRAVDDRGNVLFEHFCCLSVDEQGNVILEKNQKALLNQ